MRDELHVEVSSLLSLLHKHTQAHLRYKDTVTYISSYSPATTVSWSALTSRIFGKARVLVQQRSNLCDKQKKKVIRRQPTSDLWVAVITEVVVLDCINLQTNYSFTWLNHVYSKVYFQSCYLNNWTVVFFFYLTQPCLKLNIIPNISLFMHSVCHKEISIRQQMGIVKVCILPNWNSVVRRKKTVHCSHYTEKSKG